jgi:hypothetical protein
MPNATIQTANTLMPAGPAMTMEVLAVVVRQDSHA